jgi:hypothetical protein
MSERSKVTLEPIKSLESVIDDILQVFNDDSSYGEFFDAYTVIAQAKPEEIAHLLYYKMLLISYKQMIANGRCPECGDKLINLGQSAGYKWGRCENVSCQNDVRMGACG